MGAGASVPYEFMTLAPGAQDKMKHHYDHLYHEALLKLGLDDAAARNHAELHIKEDFYSEKIRNGNRLVVPSDDIKMAVSMSVSAGKTPLIVDPSENDIANSFYMYQLIVFLDAGKLAMEKALGRQSFAYVMETARAKLVSAIKQGRPLVIVMGKSACDFATTFNDTSEDSDSSLGSFFPLDVFRNAGKGLVEQEYLDKLFRDEDKEQGVALCSNPEKFFVMVTTQFSSADYHEYLFGNDWGLPKPIEHFQVIVVDDTKAPHIMTASEIAILPEDEEKLNFANERYLSLFDDELHSHHEDVLKKVKYTLLLLRTLIYYAFISSASLCFYIKVS
jgi:hypothetical protein